MENAVEMVVKVVSQGQAVPKKARLLRMCQIQQER